MIVHPVRRQKAIPYRTQQCITVYGSPALFLQSTYRSPVRSVPSVNIPLSSLLCSFSQNSALQSALFLQSTLRSPVRSAPSVKIPLSSPLCSFSQHSALQSALLLQSTFRSPVRSVSSVTFRSPVRSVTSHQTHNSINVTYLQTSTFFSTPKPYSYFAGLSLRGPLVDPQSLHGRTMVQQQRNQLSAANTPQSFITF